MRALYVWNSNNNFNWAVQKRRNSIWSILSLSTGEIKMQQWLKTKGPSGPHSADSCSVLFTEMWGYELGLVLIPLHWEASCHLIWTQCPHAFWPEEVSHRCPVGTPLAFCLWAPAEQNRGDRMMDTGQSCQIPFEEPPKQKRLTASRKQIFLSSSTFFRSFSCNNFSFFLSSRIFSLFCSSLTSESWEPVELEAGAGKVYPRDVFFLL